MNDRTFASAGIALLLSSLMGSFTTVAVGQVTDAAPSGLQEITVTARRRSESLQNVPESIVVLDANAIEKKNVTQINDVLASTPNLAISNGQDPGLAMINIRGIDQVRNGEAPVAFIIDGVQLIDTDNFSQNLFDIQSIQVLKGPQGAYYGRDAIGGAIVITTKPPTNEFTGDLQTTYGNGNEFDTQMSLRGPIIPEKLLFSLDGNVEHFDGLIKDVTTNSLVDYKGEQDLRARAIATPQEDLTIDVRANYSHLHAGASYYIPTTGPNDTTTPVEAHFPGDAVRDNSDFSVKVDDVLPVATFSSVTSYADTTFHLYEDLLWTPDSAIGFQQWRRTHGWTQEFRLTSPSDQRIRWMVGAYGMDLFRTVVNNFAEDTDGGSLLNADFAVANVLQHETDVSGFGQINADILKDLELTLAFRYDREGRRQTDNLAASVIDGSWSKPQPKVSLAYHWSPELTVYGTYAVGFRSGGFNAPSPAYPLLFKPESVSSYEVGFKSNFWDQRVRLEGDVFYNSITDFQVFAFVGSYQGLFNVDKSHTDGGELQATVQVSDHISLDAGFGYTNSRIDDYTLKGAEFETAIPVVPSQIIGNSLPLVWRTSYSLGAEYSHDLPFIPGWSMTWRGDFSSRHQMYWHIDNYAEEPPRNILNASVKVSNGAWSVMGYAKNLTNLRYNQEYFSKSWEGTENISYPSEPRTYGVTIRRSF